MKRGVPRIEEVKELLHLGKFGGAMPGPKLANMNVLKAYGNAKISRIGKR